MLGASLLRSPKRLQNQATNVPYLLNATHNQSIHQGNDFLPNCPSIDIYDQPNGLDVLFTTYR